MLLILLAIILIIAVFFLFRSGVLGNLFGGDKPIPTGGVLPLPWEPMTFSQLTAALVGTAKPSFMPDGKSFLIPVEGSADLSVPNSILHLQYEGDKYRISSVLPLPAKLSIQPVATQSGIILAAGLAPNLVLAYAKTSQGNYDIVARGLYNTQFNDIESMVPYGEGVIFNYTIRSGKFPMRLKKMPSLGVSTGPGKPQQIGVSLEKVTGAMSLDYSKVSHLKFVGATTDSLVFLANGGHVALLTKGVFQITEIEASLSLSVSGLRILAVSPEVAKLFDPSLRALWEHRVGVGDPLIGGEVVADQVVLMVSSRPAQSIMRLNPTAETALEQIWAVSPQSEFSASQLGWVVLSTPSLGNVDVIAPSDTDPVDVSGLGTVHTLNQYRLLNKEMLPQRLQSIKQLAGAF